MTDNHRTENGDDTDRDDHGHAHQHGHGHQHGHDDDDHDPDGLEARTRALQSLLVEKGLVTTEAVDEVVRLFEEDVGPMNGAAVVAKAWTDDEFKRALLADASSAIADAFDFDIGLQHLRVVENTATTHNVVVCTLCSCYPWSLLGLPPTWYKSPAYRSRVVKEPRAVLAEFGLDLSAERSVRVWDSSSEVRYLVLPRRPESTDGWTEAELAAIVDRDAMIGVATVEASR